MKKILNISLVAVLAVTPLVAHADIASTGYVKNQINTLDSSTADTGVTSTGTGSFLTGVTITDGKITGVTKGAPTEYTLPDATASTKGGVKVDGSTITASSGTISVGTIAQAKVSGLSDSLVAKQDVSNMDTSSAEDDEGWSKLTDAEAKTKYPSVYTARNIAAQQVQETTNDLMLLTERVDDLEDGAGDLLDIIGTKQEANTAVKHTLGAAVGSETVPVYVDENGNAKAITSYSGKATTAGTADTVVNNAITSDKILDGTITNADISSSAAIAQSKISGLTTALGNKQDKLTTSNLKRDTADGTTAKPFVKAITADNGSVTYTTDGITSTSSGSGVVKSVSVTDGKTVAVTSGTVGNTDLADNAVTTGKIADGAVTMAKTELPAKDKYANVSGVLTKQTSTVKDGRYTLVMNKKGSTITYDWEFIDGESAY